MSGPRICIIGGGSYQWTPELLADLMGMPSLKGMHIVLEDVDARPLSPMVALAGRLNEAMGVEATVSSSTDQQAALEGADFVIVTISTGGFDSMTVDLAVPERHGIRQSVGDTVGPGGINRALRNIPVLVGIARDMEQVCGDAWLLNITNPMTCLTRAVCRETSIKTVGLCHEVGNWCLDLAVALGKRWEDVRPTLAGVNHFPVVTGLDVDGEDGFALLRDIIDDVGGLAALTPGPTRPDAEKFSPLDFAQRHVLALTLFDRWGAVPAAGDRHLAEFLPWVLTEASGWGADFNIALTTIADRQGDQDGFVQHVDDWLAGSERLQTWASGELPAPVIDSLVSGTRREVPVNLPNAGQAPDVPPDAVVETMCVADADGIRGQEETALPAPFAEVVRRHAAVQEMTVEAALAGDRDLAAAAFALDPLSGTIDVASIDAMVDELLDGTARWLPRFTRA